MGSFVEEDAELQEWLESLDAVAKNEGPERVVTLLKALQKRAFQQGIIPAFKAQTPYINTIHYSKQPAYPGNGHLEWRIRSLIRWNAMAMVVRANRHQEGIGGHISTFASAATLYEVAFNHFFKGQDLGFDRDVIYFQGHAAPGIYARAYLEGRLSQEQLENFRREMAPGGGLTSYPHPWLMPHFWEFPTVSMGLGPITAIYQARFIRYLEDRGLKPKSTTKVWAFLGDGETDEPEALGAIGLAAREKLDNLIFVINCNLQRLDGPVRGNGKIIQELEGTFRGAGWNVIKVIWGADWDPLLDRDGKGLLVERMGQVVDGEYQKYVVETGEYIRDHFFGAHPELLDQVKNLSDDKLRRLRRGGHDPEKVYAAYKKAVEHTGSPTVILAKTIKGYGLGESGEGKNITHQQKKMNEEELREFRSRYGIPISDDDVAKAPFYRPAEDSPEIVYIKKQRELLGGSVPERRFKASPISLPPESVFDEFAKGTEQREVSTTMVFVRILAKLLRDPHIGSLIVPIVPDEARTFGMEALFRQCGIYSHVGQLYEPVDSDSLLYYREAKDGQILEEGINEAGALSSFIAAGTAPATFGINTIPFFIFYSMFGLQRVGDLVWAAGDCRCKGFLMGATAGRTTLAGEGLQHQDGHSHVLALPVPNLKAYDPAYAYELAVIIRDGLDRMYHKQEDVFYYITLMNENYAMPPMPEGVEEGILKGLYCLRKAKVDNNRISVALMGSGTILNEVLKAADYLESTCGLTCSVFSMTSAKALHQEASDCERFNRLHPEAKKIPYVTQVLTGDYKAVLAATDYSKILADMLSRFIPHPFDSLGTDGFGRSEGRDQLRDFFEVDWRYVAVAMISQLVRQKELPQDKLLAVMQDLKIDRDKLSPLSC